MGKLSTHVLDISLGKPGQGVALQLFRIAKPELGAENKGENTGGNRPERILLKTAITNADGRCDGPLLEGEQFQVGRYELVFAAGQYFAQQGIKLPEPNFLDEITLAFGVADASQNYHVPLVMSPWAYSTYRGS
ncbi:MAG: hydroxyisourate hydrolase [Burkholderiales bacterium]|nr:hydroxyisourate hydrolase [Burkholderiales bacterium]